MGTKPSRPRPIAHQAVLADKGTSEPTNHAASHAASNGSGADKAAFEGTASLWPSKMFDGYLGSNNSREAKGITPNGTKWTYYEFNSRDLEDNDSTYVFTLGELRVRNDDESSRDFAEDKTSVFYKGKEIFRSGDMRCRDQNANRPMTSSGMDELLEALRVVAAIEGVTAEELRSAMPVSI